MVMVKPPKWCPATVGHRGRPTGSTIFSSTYVQVDFHCQPSLPGCMFRIFVIIGHAKNDRYHSWFYQLRSMSGTLWVGNAGKVVEKVVEAGDCRWGWSFFLTVAYFFLTVGLLFDSASLLFNSASAPLFFNIAAGFFLTLPALLSNLTVLFSNIV